DHKDVASQLFAAYSRVKSVRNLASIIGEEELSALDKQYLQFGEQFEQKFLSQGEYEDRSIETTLDLGWKMLTLLPREELVRIKEEYLEKYLTPLLSQKGQGGDESLLLKERKGAFEDSVGVPQGEPLPLSLSEDGAGRF
ncbi:MAG: hypothetical protein N2Z76_03890, partial [Treponemataceae bacterium]|nr:hypothetical protein [Treponemataceae bacterium]